MITFKYSESKALEGLEIDHNDNRRMHGCLEVETLTGLKFLSVYVTDSLEQCSVGIELTKEEVIALSYSLSRMLAEG